MVCEIMKPEYNPKLDRLVARFEQARANNKGSDDYRKALAAVDSAPSLLFTS